MLPTPRCIAQRLVRSKCTQAFSRHEHRQIHGTAFKALQEVPSPQRGKDVNVKALHKKSSLYGSDRTRHLVEDQRFTTYPRMVDNQNSVRKFLVKNYRVDDEGNKHVIPAHAGSSDGDRAQTVVGRVRSVRKVSSKLNFVSLRSSGLRDSEITDHISNDLQIKLSESDVLAHNPDATPLRQALQNFQLNDIVSVKVVPELDPQQNPRAKALTYPELLAPCLRVLPSRATQISVDADIQNDRQAMQLWDSTLLRNVCARDCITRDMVRYLGDTHQFTQVYTPILSSTHGGAAARPFKTAANEFPDRELALRISPELWLKRLMVGGMDSVFEIGTSFRNEGIDASHNPEFQTCEFYTTEWNLEKMIVHTQAMFRSITIQAHRKGLVAPTWVDAVGTDYTDASAEQSWPQLDFIGALQDAMGVSLPVLSESNAREQLVSIMLGLDLKLPSVPTLPRLLDHLCSLYLEPQCEKATWIVNTPECLSPLAKSIPHPEFPRQKIALRAELFIQRKEVVNCYEEENDPAEQQRKFIDQQHHSRVNEGDQATIDDEAMPVDMDYVRALEWSMPPIGGWGCGIDRLLMLILGANNIRDVLTHGNLRQVTHRN